MPTFIMIVFVFGRIHALMTHWAYIKHTFFTYSANKVVSCRKHILLLVKLYALHRTFIYIKVSLDNVIHLSMLKYIVVIQPKFKMVGMILIIILIEKLSFASPVLLKREYNERTDLRYNKKLRGLYGDIATHCRTSEAWKSSDFNHLETADANFWKSVCTLAENKDKNITGTSNVKKFSFIQKSNCTIFNNLIYLT